MHTKQFDSATITHTTISKEVRNAIVILMLTVVINLFVFSLICAAMQQCICGGQQPYNY